MKKMRNSNPLAIMSGVILIIIFMLLAPICAKAAETEARIPVLLDEDGHWLDQNSEPMPNPSAKWFLKRNPNYAVEILRLNGNPYYATNYQNTERSNLIDQLHAEIWDDNRATDANEQLYKAVLEDIVTSGAPSNEAFVKMHILLRTNGAASDVAELQECCAAREVNSNAANNTTKTARYLFFSALGVNLDASKGAFSPQVPVILSSDGTWLDQNGNPMIEEAANWFLYNNKAYAIKILCLNKNPYYLSTWQSPERLAYINDIQEDVLDIRRIKTGYELESDEYSWIVQENLPDVSVETLREWQTQLGSNLAADRIECLITYIGQDDSAVLQGEMADYIFWTTVSKMTASGTYQW